MNGSKRSSLFLTGFLLSIGGAILFSTKAIWVKLAFRNTGVDALTLLSLRMLLALPFYLIAAWFSGKKESAIPLSKKDWGWIISLGIVGYYLSSLFDFYWLAIYFCGIRALDSISLSHICGLAQYMDFQEQDFKNSSICTSDNICRNWSCILC